MTSGVILVDMRHLEFPKDVEIDVKTDYDDIEIKDEDLEEFDIKDDILLPLDVPLETVVNFESYEHKNLVIETDILDSKSPRSRPSPADYFVIDNDSAINYTSIKLNGAISSPVSKQRNRRKAFAPQRAVPPSSVISTDNEQSIDELNCDMTPFKNDADEIQEGEDDQEVDNDSIFKGLQEEAGLFIREICIIFVLFVERIINLI